MATLGPPNDKKEPEEGLGLFVAKIADRTEKVVGIAIELENPTLGVEPELAPEEEDAPEENADPWNDFTRSSGKIFSSMGKVDATKLDSNIQKALGEPMTKRIAALPKPADLMDDTHYEMYEKHFMDDPIEAVGKLLNENKANPSKVLDQLNFIVRGAQRECLEKSQGSLEVPPEVKAKLMALEQIQDVLKSMQALEQNNCRYSKVEFAKKIAFIEALVAKSGISPASRGIFNVHFSGALEKHRHETVRERSLGVDVKKIGPVPVFIKDIKMNINTDEREKRAFDTSTKSMAFQQDVSASRYIKDKIFNSDTASKYRAIKIGHSVHGTIVNLGFTFDRTKVLNANETEIAKMGRQVKDALTIAVTEYGKGTENNPIAISYRPPGMNQPELAMAMLKSIKEKAISEGKSFYVADPNDPGKKVEFTAKTPYSDGEFDCIKKFGKESSHQSDKNGFEILHGENKTEEQYRQKIEEDLTTFSGNIKKARNNKDNDIIKDFSSTAKPTM